MWSPGEIVVRREVLSDGRAWMSAPVVVVRDEPELLVTYLAEGTPFVFPEGDWWWSDDWAQWRPPESRA